MARLLTASEEDQLRSAMQLAVLDALVQSRRWEPGQLIFQGGTCLHLAHGSPRFSEDLDFLVDKSLDLSALADSVDRRMKSLPWIPADMGLEVSKKREDRNPHVFAVALRGDGVIGSVKVKVEMFKANPLALAEVAVVVSPTQLATGPLAGQQVYVPSATLREIYVDKVFAMGARDRLKARDVFDLWWLRERESALELRPGDMKNRLLQYPSETHHGWLDKAADRHLLLKRQQTVVEVHDDLKRWLPSSFPLTLALVEQMTTIAADDLDRGCEAMKRSVIKNLMEVRQDSLVPGDVLDERAAPRAPRERGG